MRGAAFPMRDSMPNPFGFAHDLGYDPHILPTPRPHPSKHRESVARNTISLWPCSATQTEHILLGLTTDQPADDQTAF
jgi:hypothetical protein